MFALPVFALAEYKVSITPGELESALEGMASDEKDLKIAGSATIVDLLVLRNLTGVDNLDISSLEIKPGRLDDGDFFGRTLFVADELPSYIFAGTDYKVMSLPTSVCSIGDGAFSGSLLEQVNVPSSVRSIGAYAFSGMPALKSVNGCSGVETLGVGVFGNDGLLTEIDLAQMRITSIPERAFCGCVSLRDIAIPPGVRRVEKYAFADSGVSSLDASVVAEIDDYAFSSMAALKTASISRTARQGDGMFLGDASLTSATVVSPEVPAYTFSGCASLDVNMILSYAENVGDCAFSGSKVHKLVFGSGLRSLGDNVFYGVAGLDTIVVKDLGSSVPQVTSGTFSGLEQDKIVLLVNDVDYDVWKTAPYWNDFQVTKYVTGSSDDILSDSGIGLCIRGHLLEVTSGSLIERLEIYGLDGGVRAVMSPQEYSVSIDIREYGDRGGVVVRVITESSERSVKLLK